MRDTETAPVKDAVAYWVLVELRAIAGQAKTPVIRADERTGAAVSARDLREVRTT
jgi:hypothetical protein